MKRLSTNLPPIQQVIERILTLMGFDNFKVSIESSVVPGHVVYNITGSESGLLIGRDGKNLQALSKLVREIVLAKADTTDKHFDLENYVVDVDGYQGQEVSRLLDDVNNHVSDTKDASIPLPPMSPFHRRLVHSYAQDKGWQSSSAGTGNERHVIIKVNG